MSNADVAAMWVKGLRGDWSILERLASPMMRVWHSNDNTWLSREESTARMAEAQVTLGDGPPTFEDLKATVTNSGFVVQGALIGIGGYAGRTHIVQICTVAEGLISSVEEFIAPEVPSM